MSSIGQISDFTASAEPRRLQLKKRGLSQGIVLRLPNLQAELRRQVALVQRPGQRVLASRTIIAIVSQETVGLSYRMVGKWRRCMKTIARERRDHNTQQACNGD